MSREGSWRVWTCAFPSPSACLQFALFIFATIYLLQRGSTESKELDEAGRETEEQQQIGEYADDDAPAWAMAGGWRARLVRRLEHGGPPP